jgi:hypothetical protein
VSLIGGVHRAQDVPIHVVCLEAVEATDHLLEGRVALLVDPVGVVELGWPVDAYPDQEPVLSKEPAELVREQRAVGLDRMAQVLARSAVALAGLERTTEEPDTHERGLTALPGDRDLGVGVRLEQLPHVRVEDLVGHSEPVTGVERLLLQEEAVLAVEVADGTARFGQDVKVRRRRRGAIGRYRRCGSRMRPSFTFLDERHRCVCGHDPWYARARWVDSASPSPRFQKGSGRC